MIGQGPFAPVTRVEAEIKSKVVAAMLTVVMTAVAVEAAAVGERSRNGERETGNRQQEAKEESADLRPHDYA